MGNGSGIEQRAHEQDGNARGIPNAGRAIGRGEHDARVGFYVEIGEWGKREPAFCGDIAAAHGALGIDALCVGCGVFAFGSGKDNAAVVDGGNGRRGEAEGVNYDEDIAASCGFSRAPLASGELATVGHAGDRPRKWASCFLRSVQSGSSSWARIALAVMSSPAGTSRRRGLPLAM